MKKFGIFLFALLAMVSSCTDEIEDPNNAPLVDPTTGMINVTASVTMLQPEEESAARILSDYGGGGYSDVEEWSFAWEEDDVVYMLSHGTSDITYVDKMEQETFGTSSASTTYSGTLDGDATKYSLIHTTDNVIWNSGDGVASISDFTASIELATEQDGDLNSLVMISDVNSVSDISADGAISQSIKHVGAFMILAISFADVPAAWGDDVTLQKVEYSGVNTKCDIDLSKSVTDDGFYSNFGQEIITVTPKDDIEVVNGRYYQLYINILPTDYSSVKATLFFSNGAISEITKTSTEAGQSFNRAAFNGTALACEVGYEFGGVPYTPATLKEYRISSEDDLIALANIANSASFSEYQDCTFTLTDDIYLSGGEDSWVPIGYGKDAVMGDLYFAGTFDGAGHTISGFNAVSSSAHISAGLFGYIEGENTVVKNLIIENSTSTSTELGHHIGILAGTLEDGATILNCGVASTCTATSEFRGAVGGLVGRIYDSNIYNSYNQGNVTGANESGSGTINIGGLCGASWVLNTVDHTSTFINCYNSGSVTLSDETTSYSKGAFNGNNQTYNSYTTCYYLTGCAGENVLAVASTSTTYGSNPTGVTSKTDEELKELAGTLTADNSSITGAYGWKTGDNGYPTLDFPTEE